jgi:predicted patatin/cPLA2 family phospholipase
MVLEIVFGAVGILVGSVITSAMILDAREEKYQKTLDQLDKELRKDLEYYKNLSESLLHDVQYYRRRLDQIEKNILHK